MLGFGLKERGLSYEQGNVTYTPEQIINKLREAEVILNQGSTVGEASEQESAMMGCQPNNTVPMFGEDILVSPKSRRIWGNSAAAKFLLHRLRYYFRLSILWYLIQAKDVPLSGKLINPGNMSGGLIFQQGSHILPLDKVAQRYGNDLAGFLQKDREFSGEPPL